MRLPAKKRSHSPPPVGLSCDFPPLPPPPESVRTYADVTTKIFRIDRLPNLLSNGAPLAGFARRLRYNCTFLEIYAILQEGHQLHNKV